MNNTAWAIWLFLVCVGLAYVGALAGATAVGVWLVGQGTYELLGAWAPTWRWSRYLVPLALCVFVAVRLG